MFFESAVISVRTKEREPQVDSNFHTPQVNSPSPFCILEGNLVIHMMINCFDIHCGFDSMSWD